MSNNSSSNNNGGRGNVDRRVRRGGSGSSSITAKQRFPQPEKKSDGAVRDEGGDDQRSMSSAFDSFSSASSPSLADEVEASRSSEKVASPNRSYQQQQQGNEKTRGKEHGGVVVAEARRQLPLSEVVSRRAFECARGTNGELSKLIDVADAKPQGDHHHAKPTNMDAFKTETGSNLRRTTFCERPPTPAYRLEALPYGASISIDSQVGTGEETRPYRQQQQYTYIGFKYVPSTAAAVNM